MFFSSSKIGREIIAFRRKKTLFWKLVPFIEVTIVSKFHPIWCHIAQESSLGRKEWILVKIMFLETYYQTMSDSMIQCPKLTDNVQLTVLARCSLTVLVVFC
jgi:hypothetical protein